VPKYLSTDPNAGVYLSNDPNAGEPISAASTSPAPTPNILDQAPLPTTPGMPNIPSGIISGAIKGAARTAVGLGEMVHSIPGVSSAMDYLLGQPGTSQSAFTSAKTATTPETTNERIGAGLENAAEFALIPGPGKARGAARALELVKVALPSAGLARAQGASPGQATTMGAISAIPVAPLVESIAQKAVRSVLKPTVAAMRKVAGTGVRGLDAKAEQMVNFVIENGLTTPEKAQSLLAETERELQRVLSVRNAPTDAPTRALRYLDLLEKNARKAGLGQDKAAALRGAAEDVLTGVMGEPVTTMVGGQAMTVHIPRTNMTAKEALESARASSKWSTRGTWGPKDSAESVRNAAEKAVERAQRDAVKAAVPEAAGLLGKESQAIKAEEVLSRALFREGNNSMSGVAGAVELGTGRIPLIGYATKLLRSGQLGGGVRVGQLAKAIQQGDGPRVALALKQLGVIVPVEMMASAQ